jgi:hypothetical protein
MAAASIFSMAGAKRVGVFALCSQGYVRCVSIEDHRARSWTAWSFKDRCEVKLTGATCPDFDSPERFLLRDTCCGEPREGGCGCGRPHYRNHARHMQARRHGQMEMPDRVWPKRDS